MTKILKPVAVVFVACVVFTIARYAIYQTWMAFVDYDGYFTYYIARWAFDPSKAALFNAGLGASYRYQRILYPLAAYILSLGGNAALVPVSLVILNIVSITMGTLFVSLILSQMGTSPWYSLVYGLYGSQFLGLMTSLSEPMAYLFLVIGIYLWTRARFPPSVAMLAAAALTKETTLIFILAFVAHYALHRKWTRAAKMGLAIMPYALWQFVLFIWLGKPGLSGGQAFEFPLQGWLAGIVDTEKFLMVSTILIPMSYLPLFLLGMRASINFVVKKNWHPYVLMILAQVTFMLVLPGLTAREPAAMLRITQGLVLASLLYGSLVKSSRVLNYSFLWIATLAILVRGSVGGGFVLTD